MLRLLPTTLIVAFAFAACNGEPQGDSGRLTALASNTVIADLVRNVAGDAAEVESLLPGGADPHTFDPSPSDVRKVTEADIVFVNGFGLEEAAMKIIRTNVSGETPIIALAERLSDGSGDPHLWLDPTLAAGYVKAIADELSPLDPANAAQYTRRAQEYEDEIQRLDTSVLDAIGAVPAAKRKLVTTHDAFTYFADHFGLELVDFVVASPGQDPGAGEVADLTRTLESEGVPAVFMEPQTETTGRILEQAAADTGVRVCTLYSDALTDEVPTYLDMMRFNVDELVRCLGDGGG